MCIIRIILYSSQCEFLAKHCNFIIEEEIIISSSNELPWGYNLDFIATCNEQNMYISFLSHHNRESGIKIFLFHKRDTGKSHVEYLIILKK